MIAIIDNDNNEVAEAPDLESAIVALRTLLPEEQCDLRAVREDGVALAWGVWVPDVEGGPRLVVLQGQRQRQPGVRGSRYSADWLND